MYFAKSVVLVMLKSGVAHCEPWFSYGGVVDHLGSHAATKERGWVSPRASLDVVAKREISSPTGKWAFLRLFHVCRQMVRTNWIAILAIKLVALKKWLSRFLNFLKIAYGMLLCNSEVHHCFRGTYIFLQDCGVSKSNSQQELGSKQKPRLAACLFLAICLAYSLTIRWRQYVPLKWWISAIAHSVTSCYPVYSILHSVDMLYMQFFDS